MIIKTLKKSPESNLKSYYLEFYFLNPKTENHYKLPLIVKVVDKLEAISIQAAILGALSKEGMEIKKMSPMKLIYSTRFEKTVQEISNSQRINGFETIRLNFEETKENDSKNVLFQQLRVNTIKKQKTLIQKNTEDIFTLEINKSIIQ
ncbi:hypothetical protein [Flavobacterium sp. N2038]|uniref:hypothetical protein n=1 Tax=Flavobacterium sp. N2038 TaxID=2986829 RepID=UPI002224AF50|nr:hypothetical protein [Flavobacterium sp. N2038]